MYSSRHRFSVGLARALSKMGHCSRTAASRLIHEGRVRVNGKVVRDPSAPFREGNGRIDVDSKVIVRLSHVYVVLNKPRGVVTSASDEKGRQTVYSLLPESRNWLAPVGRLDKASEGLLLLTNDSAWAARITSPGSHLAKTYHVQIQGTADRVLLARLREGVKESRDLLRVKRASVLRHGHKNSWVEILLDEGKNRHIRRMLAALGVEVLRLVRVSIGPLELGNLPKGKIRELTRQEVQDLGRDMA